MAEMKKTRQISFRVNDDFAERIGRAAEREELAWADFVRKVFRLGLERYEAAGSLEGLRSETREAVERQTAMERELYDAANASRDKKKKRA